MDEPEFRDNRERSRFELMGGGGVVTADYERREGILVIRYVFAPPALRGTGAADRLMVEVAAIARTEGVKVLALCGFARRWLSVHRENRDLLVG